MLEGRELEAAAAAARLKAFRADPMRFGPRYLDGAEPIPDAAFVLRFAQGKVPAHLTADAAELRLAAEEFVRRVCLADRSDHYLALCARRDAAPDTIKANYHLLMALLHPDRQEGGADAWPESCAQRVNLAYTTAAFGASVRGLTRPPTRRGASRAAAPTKCDSPRGSSW